MLVYNITTKVDWTIARDWEAWMLDFHIPEVLGSGAFERHQFVRLLETDETEGPTYAVQYFASHRHKYNEYVKQYANRYRQEAFEKWGSHFIAFTSLMEVIS